MCPLLIETTKSRESLLISPPDGVTQELSNDAMCHSVIIIHFTAALPPEGPILKFGNGLPEIIALETCQAYTLTVSFVYANEA